MKKQTSAVKSPPHRTGGLYAKINISVKTANKMVLSLIALLIMTTAFMIHHSGFTVTFDTDGGSYIEPLRGMYDDTVSVPDPVKEGYVFTGWYTTRDHAEKWDINTDTLTGSMTLYAGWEKNES